MIVLFSILGAGFLGALTAALIFFRSIVSESELKQHRENLIGIALTLAIGGPLVAMASFGDPRNVDGVYYNGILGQYLPDWSLLAYVAGFFHAWLAIRIFRQRTH
jgi:ABC-type Fe3+-siderophore transport system permease subunit